MSDCSQGVLERCGADAPSSLDPPEITVPELADYSPGQKWIHRRWTKERQAIIAKVFENEPQGSLLKRLLRCGTNGQVQWSPSRQRYRVAITACKSSLCPRCRNARALKLVDRIIFALGSQPKHQWKLLTLTLRSSSQPLSDQASLIKRHFRKLRQERWFKHNCKAGVAILEVTWNAERGQWHPHLHCVLKASFIPVRLISKAWQRITHGSCVVDIRQVKSSARAARYVGSYLAKPPASLDDLPSDAVAQWITANQKQHWLIQWGHCLPPAKDHMVDEMPNDWESIGFLEHIIANLPNWATFLQSNPNVFRAALSQAEVLDHDETRPP